RLPLALGGEPHQPSVEHHLEHLAAAVGMDLHHQALAELRVAQALADLVAGHAQLHRLTSSPGAGTCASMPRRCCNRVASVPAGPDSPCTNQARRGRGESFPTQARISAWSACALKPWSEAISALRRTGSPKMLTTSAPSTSRRPSVPSAWKPTNITVSFSSGRPFCRWWRMRPRSHIPEAAMITHGVVMSFRARDSSGLWV